MRKYSNNIIVLLCFIILILILLNKTLVSDTIITSFYIWFNTMLPSMFPMFILSDILITYNFTNYLPKKLISYLSKIFNLSNNAVFIFLLSMISGFPLNAIIIKNSFDNKLLTKEECEHLLYFTHFSNPLFILNTVGIFYLNSNIYGIIILISHILSNIIIAIILRNKNYPTTNYISLNSNCQSFGTTLSNSINKAISSLLMISGTVTLFLILSTLITHIFNLNSYLGTLVQGILEMTMGLSSLSKLNINNLYKVILSIFFLSFGGLSIHLQVYSSIDNCFSYKNYFIGRIYQIVISIIIVTILFSILN